MVLTCLPSHALHRYLPLSWVFDVALAVYQEWAKLQEFIFLDSIHEKANATKVKLKLEGSKGRLGYCAELGSAERNGTWKLRVLPLAFQSSLFFCSLPLPAEPASRLVSDTSCMNTLPHLRIILKANSDGGACLLIWIVRCLVGIQLRTDIPSSKVSLAIHCT